MKAELVAEYLSQLRLKTGLTFDAVAERSKRSVSTVKKLCYGQTEDPRVDTVAPVVYALGGSMDEMLNPGKSKDDIKEVSVASLKEFYEFQIAAMKETNEIHISNVRNHYEQHHEDLKENYEKRLSDKREIIDMQNMQIAKIEETHRAEIVKLEAQNKSKVKIIWTLASVLFVLFVGLIALELMHPQHGWIRF